MIETSTAIEPGIYGSVPFDRYKSWDAMNMSTLLWGKTSMQHMKAAIDGELSKESDALTFGKAMHHYILEKETFEFHYQVAERCCAILKSGTNKGQSCGHNGIARNEVGWVCGKHITTEEEDDNTITADQMQSILRIGDALKGHPVVKLLRQRGGTESSAVFDVRGVLCKCRFDKIIEDKRFPAIIDLKSVRLGHGDRDKFQKALWDFDYAARAAFYVEAYRQIRGVEPVFIWVVVESEKPHAIGVYQASQNVISLGRFIFNNLIGSYKVARDTGVWSGYTTKIDELEMAEWVYKRYEGALDAV